MSVKNAQLTLAVLFAGAVSVLGCGEPSAPLPSVQSSLVSTLGQTATKRASNTAGNMGLPKCHPLPSATASATIGRSGGTLSVGPHTLDIPAGALRDRVTIVATAPSDTVARVQFQPEGLVFRKPVQLTMSYANCDVSASVQARIAYTDDALVILEYVPSVDKGWTVTGELNHFSGYAVAW